MQSRISLLLLASLGAVLAALAWQYQENLFLTDVTIRCTGKGLQFHYRGVLIEVVWCRGRVVISIRYYGGQDGDWEG